MAFKHNLQGFIAFNFVYLLPKEVFFEVFSRLLSQISNFSQAVVELEHLLSATLIPETTLL